MSLITITDHGVLDLLSKLPSIEIRNPQYRELANSHKIEIKKIPEKHSATFSGSSYVVKIGSRTALFFSYCTNANESGIGYMIRCAIEAISEQAN